VVGEGSFLDVNGFLYYISASDGVVSGIPIADSFNYVYARVVEGACRFEYSGVEPVWMASKGGWYDGNRRAVLKFFSLSGEYRRKVVLDSFNAGVVSFKVLKLECSVTTPSFSRFVPPGVYRIELQGGRGGNGGLVRAGYPECTGFGADGQEVLGYVVNDYYTEVDLVLGYDGGNGARGNGNGGNGDTLSGSGGGSSGGASYCVFRFVGGGFIAWGGSGGGGGSGNYNTVDAGGGGGGGGWGLGGEATVYHVAHTGKGGNSFAGGAGGSGDYNGSAGGTNTLANRDLALLKIATGDTLDGVVFFQPGGNGAPWPNVDPGVGATTLADISSGYARIYRIG
jgi:hypothetical protein